MPAQNTDDPRCRQKAVLKKVKDEAGTRGLEGTFYIGVPPDTILEILFDPENFRALYPSVKSIEVLARTESSVDVAFCVDAVLKEVRYVIRRSVDRQTRTIEWHELSGDLKRVRGGWKVEPTDNPQVSKLTYSAFVAVSFFVPTHLVAVGAARKMDEMVGQVRRVAAEIAARR